MKRLHTIPQGPRPATHQAARPTRQGTAWPSPVAVTLPLILALAVGATLSPVPARAAGSEAELATENARLRAEIDAIRAEERRRDRRSEILGREAEAEQGYRQSDRDYLERARPDPELLRRDSEEALQASRINRNVKQLERAANLQRDAAAARLGVSRNEYEKAMRDRFRDSYDHGTWK